MGTLTINFGPGYDNTSHSVWDVRRQVFAAEKMPDISNAEAILTNAKNIPSSSTSLTLPLRSSDSFSPQYTYSTKAVIFKNFKSSLISGISGKDIWFENYGSSKILAKHQAAGTVPTTYFDKINVEQLPDCSDLEITPLAVFTKSFTVTADYNGTEIEVTYTNPVFTEEGKNLANWYIDSSKNDYARSRLYVGVYVDEEVPTHPLNWSYPTLKKEAVLNLIYSDSVIKYRVGEEWKDCQPYYYTGGQWVPCSIQYYTNNQWKTLGG